MARRVGKLRADRAGREHAIYDLELEGAVVSCRSNKETGHVIRKRRATLVDRHSASNHNPSRDLHASLEA